MMIARWEQDFANILFLRLFCPLTFSSISGSYLHNDYCCSYLMTICILFYRFSFNTVICFIVQIVLALANRSLSGLVSVSFDVFDMPASRFEYFFIFWCFQMLQTLGYFSYQNPGINHFSSEP